MLVWLFANDVVVGIVVVAAGDGLVQEEAAFIGEITMIRPGIIWRWRGNQLEVVIGLPVAAA